MPRIHTIVTDTTVQDVDILVGSDGDSAKGNVTRNYTVGSLKTHMINSGVDASFGNLTLSGNATISGNLSVTGNAVIDGNLTFGNADTDTVAFGADIVSNIIPDVTDTYSLGSSTKKWKEIHLSGLQTSGIDFADNVYLRFGADQDFAIWHDGQDTNLSNTTGIMKFSGLSQFANNVLLPDDIHLYFGGTHSDADLKIFHDGTHSYIQESGDGNLIIESTGSVVIKSPVGDTTDLELWADNGSNNSDVWKLTAQTDNVFEIQTRDGGSFAPVMELSASDKKVYFKGDIYGPSNLEISDITSGNIIVKAAEEQPAQIEFKADKGDNNSDHWKLSAEADNVFEIQTRDSGSYATVVELSASDKKSIFHGPIGASEIVATGTIVANNTNTINGININNSNQEISGIGNIYAHKFFDSQDDNYYVDPGHAGISVNVAGQIIGAGNANIGGIAINASNKEVSGIGEIYAHKFIDSQTGNHYVDPGNSNVSAVFAGKIRMVVPTFADDSAAGTGGLTAGDVYKTSAGDLKIKL